MHIVFLGDSLVWGKYGGNFVTAVADAMPDLQISNAGVGGDTVVNLLRRVDDVLEKYEPDMIVTSVGGNDAVSHYMPKVRSYYKQAKGLDEDLVTPDIYEATYRELIAQIQLNFVQVAVLLTPTEYNVKLIEARQEYNTIAQDVAESMNVPYLDLAQHYYPEKPVERGDVDMGFILDIGKRSSSGWVEFETERAKWGYTYTFDGMHILPKTAQEFATHIVPFLRDNI